MGIFQKVFKRKKEESEKKESADKKVAKKASESKKSSKVEKDQKPKQEEIVSNVAVAEATAMAHEILLQPVLSEKSFRMQAANKYVFKVSAEANKNQVKKAVNELYGVQPVKVNIVKKQSVDKFRWGRKVGKTSLTKKAVVTMPEGTVLNVAE